MPVRWVKMGGGQNVCEVHQIYEEKGGEIFLQLFREQKHPARP